MTASAPLARVLSGGPRHAVAAALVAVAALLGLAVFAAEGTAQEQEEQTVETEVQTNGDTRFCAAGAQEDCTDAGRDVAGTLRVRVASPEGSADVAVQRCPQERSGVVVTLSRTSPGTNVRASLTGEAQSDGETQQVEESVGPVASDRSGEATVLVCGSGGGGDDAPDLDQPGLLDQLFQLVRDLLGLDAGDELPADELPGEELPVNPDELQPDETPGEEDGPDGGDDSDDGDTPGGDIPVEDLLEEADVPVGELPDGEGLPVGEGPDDGGTPDDGDVPEDGDTPEGGSAGETGGSAGAEFNADSDGDTDAGGRADVSTGTDGSEDSGALDGAPDVGDEDVNVEV